MELSDAQELNRFLYENHRLKQLEADLRLDNLILKHLLGEKLRSRLCVVRECSGHKQNLQ